MLWLWMDLDNAGLGDNPKPGKPTSLADLIEVECEWQGQEERSTSQKETLLPTQGVQKHQSLSVGEVCDA